MFQAFTSTCERLWPYWFRIVAVSIVSLLLAVSISLFEAPNSFVKIIRFLAETTSIWGIWLSVLVFVHGDRSMRKFHQKVSDGFWGDDESAKVIRKIGSKVGGPLNTAFMALTFVVTLVITVGAPIHGYKAAFGA